MERERETQIDLRNALSSSAGPNVKNRLGSAKSSVALAGAKAKQLVAVTFVAMSSL